MKKLYLIAALAVMAMCSFSYESYAVSTSGGTAAPAAPKPVPKVKCTDSSGFASTPASTGTGGYTVECKYDSALCECPGGQKIVRNIVVTTPVDEPGIGWGICPKNFEVPAYMCPTPPAPPAPAPAPAPKPPAPSGPQHGCSVPGCTHGQTGGR